MLAVAAISGLLLVPRTHTTSLRPLACGRRVVRSMCAEPGDDASIDYSLLQKRFAEVESSEVEGRVRRTKRTMTNWREGNPQQQKALLTINDWIRRLSVSGDRLACGTYQGDVILIDADSGKILQRWPAPKDSGEVSAISLDGERCISGDVEGGVWLRSADRDERLVLLSASHSGAAVSGVHWPEGGRAYSCGTDGRLVAWAVPEELPRGAGNPACRLRELQSLSAPRPILSMSTCEGYAALGLSDGTVRFCSLSPLREILSFEAHGAAVSAVELISPSQLLSGDADGAVALWRLDETEESGRRAVRFEGHTGAVVAVQGDGDKVVSAARDGTIRCWDVEQKRARFTLQGFTMYIGSLHVDASRLIADGANNAIVCLDFAEAEEEGEK